MRMQKGDGIGPAGQFVLLAGPVLSMIDSSIVNVAAPSIMTGLRVGLDAVQWVASSYLLAMGVGLCLTPWLAARMGSRRLYALTIALFGLSSLACAWSPGLGWLIAARAVQGLVAAPMVPLAMTALLGPGQERLADEDGGSSASAARRDQVSVVAGISLFAAPALGPSIGGLLLAVGSWRLVFLINVPVALAAVLAIRFAPLMAPTASRSFDTLGLLLLAPALTACLWLAHEIPGAGWGAFSIALAAVALALGAAYVAHVRRACSPLMDISALTTGQGLAASLLSGVATVVAFATVFLLPTYLQREQHASALVTGLVLLPAGIVTGIAAALADKVVHGIGLKPLVLMGLGALALTSLAFLALDPSSTIALPAVLLTARAVAVGLVTTPLVGIVTAGADAAQADDASTAFTMVMRIAGSVGIASLATAAGSAATFTSGLHNCAWMMTGLVVVATPLVLALPSRD